MVDVLLGLQWGDEGKGKIADFLTPNYDIVARFQGGPNAGHTISFEGNKYVLNTIPSGIFRDNCLNLIGNGVVVDPIRLHEEIERTENSGVKVKDKLIFSYRANLILPTHKLLDAASENAKGESKIGSTLRGIGPTYRDKTGRTGLKMYHLFSPKFKQTYRQVVDRHLALLEHYNFSDFDLEKEEDLFFDACEKLRQYQFANIEYLLHNSIKENKNILAEGAQGTLLDIDFGSYPYVTSSNTISGAVCTGLGIAPKQINKVKGIFKAYCTRVGSGPFPTELNNYMGERLRSAGNEFGATTGRPRRCGWLDLVALKYAVMINGVDELFMMKTDVLSGIDELQVGTAYDLGPKVVEHFHSTSLETSKVVFSSFEGWQEDITHVSSFNQLPDNLLHYIDFLERATETEIKLVSVGPDRSQTILKP
ncbi:MAG: adenylosuccinate synthase [Bacteroidota bacterium]|nr:adenylosuccinate synthase [Bacteroidota bacterium]